MESPDSLTRGSATPVNNADKLDKVASAKNVYETASFHNVDSSHFSELPEPAWSKFLPNPYNEKRVLNLTAFQMKWAVQVVAGIAILFFGFGKWANQVCHTTGCHVES